ncbi:multidrug resistance protein; DLP12 prophage [uncultured delta proteobacterium]|uniref:Multidrug resistance protein DLP12 prophage n=1 Tax=uncultured delta proteobacterium TaxID=34034 RepID=A0A212J5Z9_9DELT|nr:multidrug resistance protein; DLP12 prophage [uncultured delta proteobacterium]
MNVSFVTYGSLLLAIVCEVIATSSLKASEEFTRLWPTLIMAAGYLCAFYCLTIVMRTMPIGIAYALWSGLGIVLISLIGLLVFKQRLDLPACIGIGLIVAGVIVVNVFSKSSAH